MKVGLVGYSGSGKSTVFQWLTGEAPDPAKVQQGQVARADLPDERLDKMSVHFKPKKGTKYAAIAFLDTPGLMVDERKDNPRRLGILREANGLLVVLDGYSGGNLAQQLTKFRDELVFADLEILANRVEKLNAQLKRNKPNKEKEIDQAELDMVKKVQTALEAGQSPRSLSLRPEEEKLIRSFQLLTLKPEMVFVNRGDAAGPLPADLLKLAPKAIGAPVQLERELAELDEESRAVFAAELGISGSSRGTTIHDIFYGMGRIVFFTVGDDECRAWAIDLGTPAVEAAGAIHTDLSKGFVRANVMAYTEFLAAGYEEKNCKTAGTLRQESKEYVVKDGDIMHILANR
jgi:ribosome-binding ATPase YchF (GTP1/OBG family)